MLAVTALLPLVGPIGAALPPGAAALSLIALAMLGYQAASALVAAVSDHICLPQRPAGADAVMAERSQIERHIAAAGDPFGHAATDRRGLLHAVAAEPIRENQIVEFGMRPDDAVLVEGVEVVIAGPGARQPDGGEAGTCLASAGHTISSNRRARCRTAPVTPCNPCASAWGPNWRSRSSRPRRRSRSP